MGEKSTEIKAPSDPNIPYEPIKSSFFDEFPDDRKEYEFDPSKLWMSWAEFQETEKQFPYFSKNPIEEGLLFKKSSKSAWFRNKFYILYQDRLLYYKSDSHYPDKVMLLRGVVLHLAEDVNTSNEMEIKLTAEDIEKRSFIFSRNKKYSIVSAGTTEYYGRWLAAFRKCMILTNFNKYYTIVKPIAKGTFAKVIECKRVEDNIHFAVKTLEKSNILNSLSAVRSKIGLINEINVLRRLDHANIIKLFEVYEGKYNIYLVMENLYGGELFNEITKVGTFSEKHASVVALQLLRALDYIHNKGFVHRDIKLENLIFVNEGTLDLKIADFGLSENLSKKNCLFKRCGTPGYVAPEILDDKDYNFKCDIFSAGIVLYILLTGYSPFYAPNYQEILVKNKICKINFNILEGYGIKVSEQAIDLLRKMLAFEPDERPTAKEALNHPWFLDQMTLEEKKHHINLQRQQANILKIHELKIQPKAYKKSKSIELLMKTPDFFIPFDPNKIDRSPIMTPEINAIAVRLHQSESKKHFSVIKNTNEENHEMARSFYGDEGEAEEEKKNQNNEITHQGTSPTLNSKEEEEKPHTNKKYFSSTSLKYCKGHNVEQLFDPSKIEKL